MIILIDGCNVIKSSQGLRGRLEKMGFRQACDDLMRLLPEYALKKKVQKTLVFIDSREDTGAVGGRRVSCGEVHYSGGITADEAILRWIKKNISVKELAIVTNDFGLRRSAKALCPLIRELSVNDFMAVFSDDGAGERKGAFTHAAGNGKKKLDSRETLAINKELKARWNIR